MTHFEIFVQKRQPFVGNISHCTATNVDLVCMNGEREADKVCNTAARCDMIITKVCISRLDNNIIFFCINWSRLAVL